MRQCAVLAGRLGASHLTVHMGRVSGFPVWPWMRLQAIEGLLTTLRKVLPVCQHHGVRIALENAASHASSKEVASLGDCVEDFLYVFEREQSPWLSLCLDIGHANTNSGPLRFIETLGHKIIAVHCHDNMGAGDEHLGIGEGTVCWRECGNALLRINYSGPYILECFKEAPHEAAQQLHDAIVPE